MNILSQMINIIVIITFIFLFNHELGSCFSTVVIKTDPYLSICKSIFFLELFQDCIQLFGHVIFSSNNAHSVSPSARYIARWSQFMLLGEQEHMGVSSLSRAISQKVGVLGSRTGDPSVELTRLDAIKQWSLNGNLVQRSFRRRNFYRRHAIAVVTCTPSGMGCSKNYLMHN